MPNQDHFASVYEWTPVFHCAWHNLSEASVSLSPREQDRAVSCVRAWSYTFPLFFNVGLYMVAFLFNTVIDVFLLLCPCILIVCLCIFIVPAVILRLPWPRSYRAFSSAVRQGITRKDGARPALFQNFCVVLYIVLCRSVYCLCVNVYCTTATGWLPNCS